MAVIRGTSGNNSLSGTTAADTVLGLAGNDTLSGGNAGDTLVGDLGDDRLSGQEGNDTLWGGAGLDRLYAGNGNDVGTGGDANDSLFGEGGNDTLVGDGGQDSINGASGTDTLSGADGNDTLSGAGGVDLLDGGIGNDTLWGGVGNDTALGGDGGDKLSGGGDSDVLSASNGNDTLWGDAGTDTLTGGFGNDTLSGGNGNDTAIFSGNLGSYQVVRGTGTSVTLTGADGVDRASDIEWFTFSDGTFTLAQLSNAAPTARNDSLTAIPEDSAARTITAAALLGNDTDPNSDPLTISGVSGATGGTVQLSGGDVVFTPTLNYFGPARFTYTISDGRGGTSTATASFTITSVNDLPEVTNETLGAVAEDSPTITIAASTLLANDRDIDGGALSITGVGGAVGGSVSLQSGTIRFTPAADFNGTASFTYTVSDGQGGSRTGTASFPVNPVNDPPKAVNDSLPASNEDAGRTILASDLLGNDTDIDGGPLVLTGLTSGTGGTVVLQNGNVIFTPTADYSGPASFGYAIGDGRGGTSTATASFTISSVNDLPTVRNETLPEVAEDSGAYSIPVASLLANDSDVDGGTLSITGVSGAVGGSVALSGSNIVFTPTLNFSGAASFNYTVSDGQGGSRSGTASFTITPSNDDPVAVDNSLSAVNEDAGARMIASSTLLGNDTDPDGNALTITLIEDVAGGTATLQNGTVTFTPTLNFNGTASFRYTVSDGQGGTDTAIARWTVRPVNDRPIAEDDSLTGIGEDSGVLTITPSQLLGNDSDVDNDTLTITSVGNATGGTVVLQSGNVQFTPAADYNGPASFDYTISDGKGGTATATAGFAISPANDDPVGSDDSLDPVQQGSGPVTIPTSALLGNDTDPDGDTLVIAGVSGAIGGSVQLQGDEIVFTLQDGFLGTASFTYTVGDGNGGTGTAVASFEVEPLNKPPVAEDDTLTGVAEDSGPRQIAVADLLANDTDQENDPLVVTGVTGATGGTVELIDDQIVFTTVADFNGTASFTYTVADGHGGTETATVSFDVTAVEDPPRDLVDADPAPNGVNENATAGTSVNIDLDAVEPDGQALVYALVDDAGGLFTIDSQTGVVTVAAGAVLDFETTTSYQIVARAIDRNDFFVEQTFDIAVGDVGEAPRLLQDVDAAPNKVIEGAATGTLVQITASATDPEGDTVTYSLSNSAGGRFQIDAATGVVSVANGALLDYETARSHQITVRASDSAGLYTEQTFTVDLTNRPEEFLVDTSISRVQALDGYDGSHPVAILPSGQFAVVWVSEGQDGDDGGIYGRRFSNDGTPVTGEFRISQANGNQVLSSVTALADGGMLVTYSSLPRTETTYDVWARQYTASGSAVGDEFRINTTTYGEQQSSDVAALGNGYVVTWSSYEQDGSGWGVYLQRYGNGARVGTEIQVNTSTTNDQMYSTVAALEGGGFVVSWVSLNQDGDGWGVYAQRYGSDGTALGSEFRVNTSTAGDQWFKDVTALGDGGFLVTYSSPDGNGNGVFAQRYDPSGNTAGGEFRVNTRTTEEQLYGDAVALEDGGFIVAWTSFGQDGSRYGVYGQRYDANGAKVGGEVRINDTTAGDQEDISLELLSNGDLLAVWRGSGIGDAQGIFAKVYEELWS
jgi:hypothetical protein